MSEEKQKAFWAAVAEAEKRVAKWPDWKKEAAAAQSGIGKVPIKSTDLVAPKRD